MGNEDKEEKKAKEDGGSSTAAIVVQSAAPSIKVPSELSWTGNMSENWSFFKQKFDIYMIASKSNKENSEYQIALLLSVIGDRALKIYNNFSYLPSEDKKDIKVVLSKFDSYFIPNKNVTYERHIFFLREQKQDENIDSYVTELRDLSSTCEFGTLTDSLIKDRLILGIKDRTLKDRLLRTKDLTLNQALEVCRAAETANKQLQEICSEAGSDIHKINVSKQDRRSSTMTSDAIRRQSNQRRRRGSTNFQSAGRNRPPPPSTSTSAANQDYDQHGRSSTSNFTSTRKFGGNSNSANLNRKCFKCGYNHQMGGKCPAFGKRCGKCGNLNHFASQCKNKNVNCIDDDLFVGSINTIHCISTKTRKQWSIELLVENCPVSFKIDTGAEINVLNQHVFDSLCTDAQLTGTDVNLTSYTGQRLNVTGKCTLDVVYKNRNHCLEFFVVNAKAPCILGLSDSVELNLIKRVNSLNRPSSHLSSESLSGTSIVKNRPRPTSTDVNHKVDLDNPSCNILNDYPDLMSGIGSIQGFHKIILKNDVVPVIHASRKVPVAIRPKLKSKLESLERLKIIERVEKPTEWVQSLVIVYKPNNDLRLCLDPKELNAAIMRPHFQMPSFEEIASKMAGAKYFSTLDSKNGFWHIKLDSESSDLTTFNTPFGRFKFLRLPYGLCSASEVFQQKMKQIFDGFEGVEIYVDDLIVWGRDRTEHDLRLRHVLDKMRAENIKLNKDKCKIGIKEISYLGFKFTEKGIDLDDSKVRAITSMEPPCDKKSLQRFLGLVTYVSRHLPNVSEHTAPLRAILRKDTVFSWQHEQQKAFEKLKELLTKRPILQYFDVKKPIVLTVDSSQSGLGAALLQDGLPVAYASKALSEVQRRYAQIERELLAIVFACERYHQYIFGSSSITVETDHKPLLGIFQKNLELLSPRLQRMRIKLQQYNLNLVYKKGKELFIADTLSRAYDTSDNADLELEHAQIEAHETWFVVPKPPRGPYSTDWRLSFPKQETEITRGLEFLKYTLRLMKRVRDQFQFKAIASYYIKTLFLWEIQLHDRNIWVRSRRGRLFIYMLIRLKEALEAERIPFFWDERCNLVEYVGPNALMNFCGRLRRFLTDIDRLIDEGDYEKLQNFIKEKLSTPKEKKEELEASHGCCTIL